MQSLSYKTEINALASKQPSQRGKITAEQIAISLDFLFSVGSTSVHPAVSTRSRYLLVAINQKPGRDPFSLL